MIPDSAIGREDRLRRELSAHHRRMLYDESGISPEIVGGRGYKIVTRREDLPPEFKAYQRRRGLLIPVHSPDGMTRANQLRLATRARTGRASLSSTRPRAARRRSSTFTLGCVQRSTQAIKTSGSRRGSRRPTRSPAADFPPWGSWGFGTGSATARCYPAGITSGSKAAGPTSSLIAT